LGVGAVDGAAIDGAAAVSDLAAPALVPDDAMFDVAHAASTIGIEATTTRSTRLRLEMADNLGAAPCASMARLMGLGARECFIPHYLPRRRALPIRASPSHRAEGWFRSEAQRQRCHCRL
jgi:hypothetical protein